MQCAGFRGHVHGDWRGVCRKHARKGEGALLACFDSVFTVCGVRYCAWYNKYYIICHEVMGFHCLGFYSFMRFLTVLYLLMGSLNMVVIEKLIDVPPPAQRPLHGKCHNWEKPHLSTLIV